MNVQAPVHMEKAAFLAWMREHEGRYELVDGRVVMMPGVSRAHGLIVRNLVLILGRQLDPAQWDIIAEFGLDAGPQTLRYPDIVVDRAGGSPGDYTAIEPILLIEVLSPSTEHIDLRDKAAEYLQLPSLAAYVVFAQSEPRAWFWSREQARSPDPIVVAGNDAIVRVAALRVDLRLAEVYAGVRLG